MKMITNVSYIDWMHGVSLLQGSVIEGADC